MALPNDYYQYFKLLCENHPLILHNSSANGKAFAMIDLEHALGDFRAGAKGKKAIFRLINIEGRVGDNGSHEVSNEVNAGFVIAHYYGRRDSGPEEYIKALDASWTIVDHFIERIILDSQNGHPLFHRSLDANQDFLIRKSDTNSTDGAYVGYLVLFDFVAYFEVCEDNRAGWLDGGVTEYGPGFLASDDNNIVITDANDIAIGAN